MRTAPLALSLAAGALALAGCGAATVARGGPAPPPAAAASSSPAAPLTGKVGTTYTVTGTDDSGAPMSYTITMTAVSQDAAPDSGFDAAPPGQHLAWAEFSITGTGGSASDDADSDAAASGTNQQVYGPAFGGVAAGTNFSDGVFTVAAGQTQVGYVTFQLPDGITVASVSWQPGLLGSGRAATWTV